MSALSKIPDQKNEPNPGVISVLEAIAAANFQPYRHRESFGLRDKIKQAGGRWSSIDKVWLVPLPKHAELNIAAAQITQLKTLLWDQAATDCGTKYARRDTPEYALTSDRFRELCKARGV